MKIHIISNGYGEDLIAAHLAVAIRDLIPDVTLIVTPLVGDGHRFVAVGLQPSLYNAMMPSGGFLRRFTSFFQDVMSGMLGQLVGQWRHINQLSEGLDLRICVGDVFCLVMGSRGVKTRTVFLPTAKSEKFMPHSKIEYRLVKRLADLVITRDEETAAAFKAQGIKSEFLGNPMMDGLVAKSSNGWLFEGEDLENPAILTILPGSRDEAYDNMAYLFRLLARWKPPVTPIVALVAKAPSLSADFLIQSAVNFGWEVMSDAMIRCPRNGVMIEFTSRFVDALSVSRVVIGLAGTANEQAVFLNRPVICFEGFGPQSTLKRFEEQRKLMGELIHVVRRGEKSIFGVLNRLILVEELGAFPPVQGAAREIADRII